MSAQIAAPPSRFKLGECRTMSQEKRSWRTVEADLVKRTGLEKEETTITPDRHLVLLNLKGDSERGDYFLDDRKAEFVRRKPGAILFIPAGCNWRGWEMGAPTAAYLSISLDPVRITELFGHIPRGSLPSLSPDLGFEDPIIMDAARGIGAEIRDRNPLSTVLVEGYTTTIFAQLMRRQRYTRTARRGGLGSANLARVIQKIDDDLTTDMSLLQLADMVGLSVPHFCRAFRQTVGFPPYAFIIRRRIERAKEYLRHSSWSITEIALSCGFSSSSHFSNTFRSEVGMTALEYRALWPQV